MRIELKVPPAGESISEVEIGGWKKTKGDQVQRDEVLVVLESEKATVELPAPVAGVLADVLKPKGATAQVGEVIAYLDDGPPSAEAKATPQPAAQLPAEAPSSQARVMPAAQRVLAEVGLRAEEVPATGPGGRLLKEDVQRRAEAAQVPAPSPPPAEPATKAATRVEARPSTEPARTVAQSPASSREQEAVPMTRLRRTVAERLVQAQHNAALLTTFNEIDMTVVLNLRKELGEAFQARHGTKLGFMSFFVKAAVDAVRAIPQVNAEIRGNETIYYKYCDIGVAIGGGKGLVVPVLRNAERMSFAEIELAIADFARRARESKLKPDELQGGTFTISNGGVYGSLLSTPIVNPPQSGVLGMHAIQERPVAREGQVVIRPMMYVALTYDHRLVDGREAVTFLRHVKEFVENPVRMLVGV
jgi:2-oxoglutarate dehydrogenase E2 component (dihydrolipoamide succinyltransferase)